MLTGLLAFAESAASSNSKALDSSTFWSLNLEMDRFINDSKLFPFLRVRNFWRKFLANFYKMLVEGIRDIFWIGHRFWRRDFNFIDHGVIWFAIHQIVKNPPSTFEITAVSLNFSSIEGFLYTFHLFVDQVSSFVFWNFPNHRRFWFLLLFFLIDRANTFVVWVHV